jgi:DNA polymerase III alpha subunit
MGSQTDKPTGHGCGTGAAAEGEDRSDDGAVGAAGEQGALAALCAARMRARALDGNEGYARRLEYELEQVAAQGKAGYLIDLARRCKSEGVQHARNENGLLVEWLLNITPQDPVKDGVQHRFKFFGDSPDVDLDFCSLRRPEVEEYLKRKYGQDHVVHIGAYGTFSAKSALKEMARAHGLMETDTETELWFSKFAKDFDPHDPVSKEDIAWNLAYIFGEESLSAVDESGETVEKQLPPSPWTRAEIEEGRKFHEAHREVFDLASKVVGQITHFTAHAAGVAIFPKPAWLHTPLKFNAKKGQIQTALQEGTRFKEITQAGIIKIDILGLTLNSVMAMAMRLVEERRGVDLWDAIWPKCPAVTAQSVERGEAVLDIDDPAILEAAREGHNIGSFQFGSAGISNLLKRIHPDSFEDIVAANALYRPGTIRAGEAEAFAWRKAKTKARQGGADALSRVEKRVLSEGYTSDGGKRKARYTDYAKLHPAFAQLLKDTHGSLVYQEQVMQTFADIAGFSMQDADSARKTLVKASQAADRKERLAALSKKASEAAARRGMSPQDVDQLIAILANFSGYSFNKSHSASYALAYAQVQFLKIYFPVEFLAALLSFSKNSTAEKKREDDPDLHLHIQEANRMGFRVVRPLCNLATGEFTIHKVEDLGGYLSEEDADSKGGVLMWSLQHLIGVGEKQAAAIVAAYPARDMEDFCERVDGRVVNKNVVARLIKIGFFDTLYADDPPEARRALAWKHFHEDRQGMLTLQAAVQKVRSHFQESKDQITALALTPQNLVAIEAMEKRVQTKAKELREAGDTQAIQTLYRRKREKAAELDPRGERRALKALLREVEQCSKMKKKLSEKRDSVVYSELVDDIPNRIVAEREAYGVNIYTNALTPYMGRLLALVRLAPAKHRVTLPEAVRKVPPSMRQNMTVVGELQTKPRKLQYTDSSGKKKTRLVGKISGRNGRTLDLVAFDIGDDFWTLASGAHHKVVAVTGKLGDYQGSPQIMVSRRTDWLRRPGIEVFDVFEPAFAGHFGRKSDNG